ncbi:hypothetical protein SBRCBS47491_003259 [Sporothrix bragantina]|uniref:SMP-30/Gluconolactonase/LRE-like region domain-containing protein n=1 Tax=Sporothrix bragantina TaxID=671064 RepID=A0ABP0BDR8_9PEZI
MTNSNRKETKAVPAKVKTVPGFSLLRTAALSTAIIGTLYQAGQQFGFSLPTPQFLQPKPGPLPPLAQVIDQRTFNVLPYVPPASQYNAFSNPFTLPGHTSESLLERPFHVYDPSFIALLGPDPTLTRIAVSEKNPLFHEAVVWSRSTNEAFFVQFSGHQDAGTGLNKSAIVQKISLADAAAAAERKKAGAADEDTRVPVTVVNSTPQIINPNGGTNFRGQIIFAGEGMGDDIPSALYVMNPLPPYNTTVLVNNYFGRQFSSLNDVAVHPRSHDVYFTDTLCGLLMDFRPAPGLRNQVYRWVEATGALTVVADGFTLPNGLTFSPDGKYAYVTDTGVHHGFYGFKYLEPATIYRYDVLADGTFDNRKTFAYVDSAIPDGVHCDTQGNLYAGCGDGIQVWNPSGTLLGKIYLGTGVANFQFMGTGRMVVCAETELYYVTLAATGAVIESEM